MPPGATQPRGRRVGRALASCEHLMPTRSPMMRSPIMALSHRSRRIHRNNTNWPYRHVWAGAWPPMGLGPTAVDHARSMLQELIDRSHGVVSDICVLTRDEMRWGLVEAPYASHPEPTSCRRIHFDRPVTRCRRSASRRGRAEPRLAGRDQHGAGWSPTHRPGAQTAGYSTLGWAM